MAASKILRCTLCDKRYSEQDVETLNFFPEELICFSCYDEGSKQDHRVWCFGKRNVKDEDGRIASYGYDPGVSADCRLYCADRKICYLFITKKIHKARIALQSVPFKSGTVSAKAFVMCVIGTTKPKLLGMIRRHDEGKVKAVMANLKKEKVGDTTWTYSETGTKVRIRI